MGISVKRIIEGGALSMALIAPVAVYAQANYAFDLPAQSLANSLRELGSQAHVNVVFDPTTVRGLQAKALKGSYGLKQALDSLLNGSGLTSNFTGSGTVIIKPGKTPTNDPRQHTGDSSSPESRKVDVQNLKTITVLGSLIPRSQIETASPLITVTAQDIKDRGFSSVADALQNLSINTGAVNNNAIHRPNGQNGIWAVKTVSLFGLDPAYTKFLIDGRPMPAFSQALSGSSTDELYTNLSSIPIDLVERIEILPGGQSSLYGSDAIAGVINIVLKKHARVGTINARYGWYSDGGGRERMLSASKSFDVGKLNLMVGAQVNDQQPMWDYQRRITAQNFAGGINPQLATPNVQVQGLYSGITYFPAQPSDCSSLSALWGGSERYHENPYGAFCGSTTSNAYQTLMNKQRGANLSVHADYTINDNVQLYADVLDNYQEQSQQTDSSYNMTIFDPNLGEEVVIQRDFAPEERAGSTSGLLTQKSYENALSFTLGSKLNWGDGWGLDVGFTRSMERDDNRQIGLLASGSYINTIFGPKLGSDPYGAPIYQPNYGLLFSPTTPAQLAQFQGAASIASTSRNDLLRSQLTQTSLFSLPGGDAGLALVAEEGFESWKYLPGPLLVSNGLLGYNFNPSSGHRTRYATAAELNLPLFKMLTADLSGRYDSYDAEGSHFSHPTYALGLEFRPFKQLLLRARYSTSFKAPELIDLYEGSTTIQSTAADYVNCGRLGFSGSDIIQCPSQYFNEPDKVITKSNPNLKPLTAKSFSYGVVWSPTDTLSMNVDYQHTSINNEVLGQSDYFVLKTELECDNGTLDPASPTCEAIKSQITRAPSPPGSPLLGNILSVVATKMNIAHEVNNSLIAGLNDFINLGRYGLLRGNISYTRVLNHRQKQFPGDPLIDFLRNPSFSTEYQYKANIGLSWNVEKWGVTLFGTRFGPTPNFMAQLTNGYSEQYAGRVSGEWLWNGSVNYSPTPSWQLSLRVNNIRNSMPPIDITSPGYSNLPFAPGNYNPYGREIFVEARYQFGHGD